MKQVELSRRNFLKWSAGAVAGIALLELDHPVYRVNVNEKVSQSLTKF